MKKERGLRSNFTRIGMYCLLSEKACRREKRIKKTKVALLLYRHIRCVEKFPIASYMKIRD